MDWMEAGLTAAQIEAGRRMVRQAGQKLAQAQALPSQAVRARAELEMTEASERQRQRDEGRDVLAGLVLDTIEPDGEPGSAFERLLDLLYDALTIQPCHLSSHEELHRTQVVLCEQQASVLAATLLEGLKLMPRDLPRAAHGAPGGGRAACCASDGRVGTWIRWGMTVSPQFGADLVP